MPRPELAYVLARDDRQPPINVMGPEMVMQFQEVINALEADAELDAYVEALATRIAKFDKWAIANNQRLVNTRLPPDAELGAGSDACIASLGRPAAEDGIKALMAQGFHKPGDVEDRLGSYLGQIPRHRPAMPDDRTQHPNRGDFT